MGVERHRLESGVLWQVGKSTPLSYRRSQPAGVPIGGVLQPDTRWRLGNRASHRLALLGTWVQSGPESRYVGIAGCPSLEWWDKTGRRSWFTGTGGGAGWIDSRDVVGGQGQDFTLNRFVRAGAEHVTLRNARLSAGVMFQHMSNGGRTNPNPGIDALGFTLAYVRSF